MVEHATDRVIRVTPRATLDGVLDQLRLAQPGPIILSVDPLSALFATPDHFRALDAVRLARGLSVALATSDPHRTGLALAFGYRVATPVDGPPRPHLSEPRPVLPPAQGTHALVTAAPTADVVAQRPTAPARTRRRVWRVAGGWRIALALTLCLSLVGAGGIAILARVHTAVVTLIPAEQSFSRVVPFAVSVGPTDDPNALQTTPFSLTVAREA